MLKTAGTENIDAFINSLEFYQDVYENAPDMFLSIDPVTRTILTCNETVVKITGYTKEELIGCSIARLYHPDYIEKAAQTIKLFLEQGEVHNIPFKIVSKTNEIIDILLSATAIRNHDGEIIATRSMWHVVTQQKRLEEELQKTNAYLENLVNYANVPIIVWDPELRITRFNNAFEVLTGFTEQEVLGQSLKILFPEEFIDESMALINKTLTGERWETVEIRIRNRSGEVKFVLWNSATLFAPDGTTPIATIAQGKDITLRKKIEEELRTLNHTLEGRVADRTRELEEKNQELKFHLNEIEQLTYISSHDLQEPLRTLINFTTLLKEDFQYQLGEFGNIYIDFIAASANRMQALVKGLLDYALLGKESEKQLVDINSVVTEVQSDLAGLIESSSATIETSPLPVVRGFASELRMLFQNLLSNAIKYRSGEVPPVISISCKEQSHNWLFSVEDNGIGIEASQREKVFILFKRLHNRNQYSGIGIGLAHCKKIAELHKGKIWIETGKSGGSNFRFTIPK